MSVNTGFVKVIGWKEHSGVRVAFGYIVNSIKSTCKQSQSHLGKSKRNHRYDNNGFL